MLNFPSYSFFLLIALVMLVGGLVGAMRCFYKWLTRHYSEDDFKLLFASFGFSLLSLFGGWAFYAGFVDTYKFRNIDISKVSEFEIVESEKENSLNGEQVKKLQDRKIIKEMLESLQNCKEFTPNHEWFRDGYKIRIVIDNDSNNKDLFISVYKRNNKGNEKKSLMPHRSDFRNVNLGNYDCAKFQDLVAKNIDPLFQSRESSEK